MRSDRRSAVLREHGILCSMIFVISLINTALVENDLSEKSLDELFELRERINTEIELRIGLIDSSMIFVGDYTAGIDIKPGTYVITCTKAKEHASDGMTIAIYEPGENYKVNKNKSVYYEFRDNAKAFIGIDFGGSAIISLQEGEHLIIRWGEGTLRSFTPSWAP